MPSSRRIFLLNALVLIAATALLPGPVTVSTPVLLTEADVLTVVMRNCVRCRRRAGPVRARSAGSPAG